MKKRGLTLTAILEILLAIPIILLLLYVGSTVFAALLFPEAVEPSKGCFKAITERIDKVEIGEVEFVVCQITSGWILKAFDAGKTSPQSCFGNDCLCVCKKGFFGEDCKNKGLCEVVEKNVRASETETFKPLGEGIYNFFISKTDKFILVSTEKLEEPRELTIPSTDTGSSGTGSGAGPTSSKVSTFVLNDIELTINSELVALEQQYNFNSVALTRALIRVESGGNAHAISNVGAVGLVQLMPKTAESLGLRVWHDPKGYYNSWEKSSTTKYAELLKKEYANNKAALLKIDERFDAKKNVDAGTRYLAQLIKKCGSVEKALGSYNSGKCKEIKYSTLVMVNYNKFVA